MHTICLGNCFYQLSPNTKGYYHHQKKRSNRPPYGHLFRPLAPWHFCSRLQPSHQTVGRQNYEAASMKVCPANALKQRPTRRNSSRHPKHSTSNNNHRIKHLRRNSDTRPANLEVEDAGEDQADEAAHERSCEAEDVLEVGQGKREPQD